VISFDETIENAWMRAHARCECRRASHGHLGRCGRFLLWADRGLGSRECAWEAYCPRSRKATFGWEAVNQYEILCWECYIQASRLAAIARAERRVGTGSWVGR
jgi:hypothetical protein